MRQDISFLFKEIITCGAVLSTFELVQALRRLGQEAHIVSQYNNPELEEYFGIQPIRAPVGITVAVSPLCPGEWAYVRTKDERWKKHPGKKIAVSKWIADWIETDIIIGNGTHERFHDMKLERDINVLIEGNYEPNKNIDKTLERARDIGGKIVWFGRRTVDTPWVECLSSPRLLDIPILYNRSRTFLKASKEEGWGRPIAEAKACGVPNIINLSGGNQDIQVIPWKVIAIDIIKTLCM